MDWIEPLLDWAAPNKPLLWWLFAASLALLLLTPLAVGLAVVRMPDDYFTTKRHRPLESWTDRPILRAVLLVAKNLLGLVLAITGVVMLLVPGQGLLTIVVGLVLLDFPGKFRLVRWLATRRPVWRSLNWLRQRAGRKALQKPS